MAFTNEPTPGTSITIPTGASTGPRIVIGSDVPPELQAWANANNVVIVAVILEYWNDTDYRWEATGSILGVQMNFTGMFTAVNGIYLVSHLEPAASVGGQPLLKLGDTLNAHQLSYFITNTFGTVEQSSSLQGSTGTGGTFQTGFGSVLTGGIDSVNQTCPVTTTNNNIYSNYSNIEVLPLKCWDNTLTTLMFHLSVSCWVTTQPAQVAWAVNVAGTDHDLIPTFFFNIAQSHLSMSAMLKLTTSIPNHTAGVPCQLRWRSITSNNINTDGGDYVSFSGWEVSL